MAVARGAAVTQEFIGIKEAAKAVEEEENE